MFLSGDDRMRKIYCVKATFSGVRAGAYAEKGLSRVQADGKALFTQMADFTEPGFVSRIPEGLDVYMGVQAFPDGTFWMHWLHAPGLGTAEPPPRGAMAAAGLKVLLGGLAGLLFGGWLFLGMRNAVLAVLGCFIIIIGCIALYLGIHALLVACNGKTRRLRRDLENVKAGKAGICVPLKTLKDFDPEDGGLSDMLAEMGGEGEDSDKHLFQAEGAVSHVTAESLERGAGKYRQYFIQYAFMCAGRFVSLTISEDTPMLHAVFRGNHPFMLAEGDRVRLIVGEDTRTVKAMRNFEDGCAYWLTGSAGKGKVRKIMKWFLLFPVGIPLLFTIFNLIDHGRIDFGLIWTGFWMSAAVAAGMIALLWVILALARGFGTYRADLPVIIEALELHPAKNRTKPYIHEL